MLPYIILGWTKVSALGVGVAVSILVFLYSSYLYCKKNQLDFKQLFFALPRSFLIIYVTGKFVGYYLQSKQLIWGVGSLWYILSPNGSDFHYVGIIIWALISLLLFFSNKPKNNIKSIVDMLFISTMRMCMTLGVFLTLSDTVIGLPNDQGRFAVSALVPYSKIQSYGQVYPYGIIISIVALTSYVATKILDTVLARTGTGYLWFALFFVLMTYSFSYQLYPKHGVMSIGWVSLDIKHYINIFLIVICLLEYYKVTKSK